MEIFIFLASLSTILETPIKIHKIRAGRASPGLKAQHLTGLSLGKPFLVKNDFLLVNKLRKYQTETEFKIYSFYYFWLTSEYFFLLSDVGIMLVLHYIPKNIEIEWELWYRFCVMWNIILKTRWKTKMKFLHLRSIDIWQTKLRKDQKKYIFYIDS